MKAIWLLLLCILLSIAFADNADLVVNVANSIPVIEAISMTDDSPLEGYQVNNTGSSRLVVMNATVTDLNGAGELTLSATIGSVISMALQEQVNATRAVYNASFIMEPSYAPGDYNVSINASDGTDFTTSEISFYYTAMQGTLRRNITVCSSGCNFTSVQPAIDSALPGDNVVIGTGTYSPFSVSGRNNINIIGSPATVSGSQSYDNIIISDSTGINITNINSVNGRVGVFLENSTGIVVSGVDAQGSSTLSAFVVQTSGNVSIFDSEVKDSLICIDILNSANVLIKESRLQNCTDTAIYAGLSRSVILDSDNISQSKFGAYFEKTNQSSIDLLSVTDSLDAIDLISCADSNIVYLDAKNLSDAGVYIENSTNVIINNSTVNHTVNNAYACAYVKNSKGAIIETGLYDCPRGVYNDNSLFNISDSVLKYNQRGIYLLYHASQEANTYFNNTYANYLCDIRYEEGCVGDYTPPYPISDLSAKPGMSNNETVLTWTATGNNMNYGTASSYILRYSTSPNFESASTYSQSWVPLASGSSEEHSVIMPTTDTYYYFAIIASDGANNSTVSNSPGALSPRHNLNITSVWCINQRTGRACERAPLTTYSTLYVYDRILVYANVSNKGNIDENKSYNISSSLTSPLYFYNYGNSSTYNVASSTNSTIGSITYKTESITEQNGTHFYLKINNDVSTGYVNCTNSGNANCYIWRFDSLVFNWYNSSNPSPTYGTSDLVRVRVSIINTADLTPQGLGLQRYYDFPLNVVIKNITDSSNTNILYDSINATSTVKCFLGNHSNCLNNLTSSSSTPQWTLNPLPIGTYNITVTLGGIDSRDLQIITRTINVI